MATDDDEYICDCWPKMPNGKDFDGSDLLNLVRKGSSPFKDNWNVNELLQEIEAHMHAKVVDIPHVSSGSNNMGLHMKLSNQREILVRLGRADVNVPNYDGFPFDTIVRELNFESATYTLLSGHPEIPVSTLLYMRPPVKHESGVDYDVGRSVQGRRLMVFDFSHGRSNVWWQLLPGGKDDLVSQAARLRASLFNYDPPKDFVATFLLQRIFAFMPSELPCPVEPTRDFWLTVFRCKIEATIKNEGDMIGWEYDHNTVGPEALKAKQSILRFLPHMLPSEENEKDLYRMVLEHGDFGIHNMSITTEADKNHVHIKSLYDWETGCIWPAMLSDPEMALPVDLNIDENGKPAITRVSEDETAENRNEYMNHAKNYIEVLYQHAPDFERVTKAGKDARYLWFQLKRWRGDDPEEFFGELGAWAERRMAEKGV
ncbi:hypothetical protein DER45DRAFT_589472 [Fusarium avenaceum]|nr:hypothetical protein DER45DRAFT_589472 [Fusarium avenaceum]